MKNNYMCLLGDSSFPGQPKTATATRHWNAFCKVVTWKVAGIRKTIWCDWMVSTFRLLQTISVHRNADCMCRISHCCSQMQNPKQQTTKKRKTKKKKQNEKQKRKAKEEIKYPAKPSHAIGARNQAAAANVILKEVGANNFRQFSHSNSRTVFLTDCWSLASSQSYDFMLHSRFGFYAFVRFWTNCVMPIAECERQLKNNSLLNGIKFTFNSECWFRCRQTADGRSNADWPGHTMCKQFHLGTTFFFQPLRLICIDWAMSSYSDIHI